MSFLNMAENEPDEELIHVFTKLLSVSERPLENHLASINTRSKAVWLEATERWYVQLLEKLLELKIEMTTDVSLRVLRSAVSRGSSHLLQKLLELNRSEISADLAAKDEDEKTLLHYAAESDDPEVFGLLDKFRRSLLHSKAEGENDNGLLLHSEIEGEDDHQLVDVLTESRDYKGRTPLHIAASKGNKSVVDKLLVLVGDDKVVKYVRDTDSFGRTALQMASRAGHRDIVKVLLDKGKRDPLKERDVYGKTALHYAAQANDPQVAVAICKQLLERYSDSTDRSLLLWASAGGIGTADEGGDVHPYVKTFLESRKASDKTHLLREAAYRNNVEMAWELLNRGAEINDLRDPEWRKQSSPYVRNVLHQLELLKEQGRDQPSMEDNLGRNVFAEGLAALFLNRFIESPITVGICGEWGMGKSSLMILTEKILLLTAAQLTFPNLLKSENFVGAEKISLSREGRKIYENIRKGAFSLLVPKKEKGKIYETIRGGAFSFLVPKDEQNLFFKICIKIIQLWRNFVLKEKGPLVEMLKEYQPQYHSVYKSLACMDSDQMVDSLQPHAVGRVPRILTVRYNAWQYYDQHEAWAGLAVTISKEIEKSMTRAEWFSTGWRYSWNKNKVNICVLVLLPCLLAAFLAGWIAWAAWILLKEAKFQGLQYGSIPLTIMTIVWIVLKSIISVVQPVSVQMIGYITSPDHTSRLGYQEQVISDINFLKTELGKRPHWFFSLILGEWCWNWFGLYSNNVENTSIAKFKPASEDHLRIITFVDDLDRCEEKVILQVLSAVNLVLANCKINVVLGIDRKMVERAIRRNFEDVEDIDLVDKFMCKIIQIPLSLPDPSELEMTNFLKYRLGRKPQPRSSIKYDTDYGTSDDEVEDALNKDQRQENRVLHIHCDPLVSRCPGFIGKALNWFSRFLKISYSIACNISSELQPPRDQSDAREMYPMTFSKGAKLTREMVLTKYTEEEADTFEKLRIFATGDRKLPREWKRLLNYHRLAWNVLTKRGEVHGLRTWKVELVAWIFVCWQWKKEMNVLIKGWSKHIANIEGQNKDGSARGRHGPLLSQIVEKCMSAKCIDPQGNSTAKERDNYREVRGRLREDNLVSLYVNRNAGSIAEDDPSQDSWAKLQEALRVQNVSMKGIQLFQLFRFHCDTDHLPWPLRSESKDK